MALGAAGFCGRDAAAAAAQDDMDEDDQQDDVDSEGAHYDRWLNADDGEDQGRAEDRAEDRAEEPEEPEAESEEEQDQEHQSEGEQEQEDEGNEACADDADEDGDDTQPVDGRKNRGVFCYLHNGGAFPCGRSKHAVTTSANVWPFLWHLLSLLLSCDL